MPKIEVLGLDNEIVFQTTGTSSGTSEFTVRFRWAESSSGNEAATMAIPFPSLYRDGKATPRLQQFSLTTVQFQWFDTFRYIKLRDVRVLVINDPQG